MTARRTFAEFEEDESYVTEGRTVTDSDVRMFVGATGSTDPIHVDREYADAHPLVDDVVLQGTLLLGIADGFLVDAVASDAALAMNLGHRNVRYLAPVSPGDTVHGEVAVTGLRERNEEWGVVECRVELVDADDETVVVDDHDLLVATAANPAVDR
ncbi:MaoC family dehydratase [Halorarius halobius]|uniref:MaoC family dehydratase n=1 Tax=Halorarius halobius TaxID=2962671 RepID=UPI0020CD8390|nr:MaoC/PaaZ C-terminal domain-containing protein [Halorarius halobius]